MICAATPGDGIIRVCTRLSILCLLLVQPCEAVTLQAQYRPLDVVVSALPSPSSENIWMRVRNSMMNEELAFRLRLPERVLAQLNRVNTDHRYRRNDWLVIPASRLNLARQIFALDTSEIRRAPPPAAMSQLKEENGARVREVSSHVEQIPQVPLQAQSAESVAKVAQAISVRLESATPGSGVLVKRDGNRYIVLTAWHVVSGHRPGEELDIYTPDGVRHSIEQGSIKRLGEVDLAVLTFSSSNSYEVALVGDVKSVSMGSPIYVVGFPLPSSAVPTRLIRFLKGDVVANAQVFIPNGYQLLYSNPTLPGMSGGPVLNAQGQLVGIHGQAETDSKMSEHEGIAVKTGTNQGVPITYYRQWLQK